MPARVLVVDDNRDVADTLGMVLELHGAAVRVAYGGADALRADEEFRPHAGLFDINMPGMDGCELARRVRERHAGQPLLLVAVTGVTDADAVERTAAAGFDRHVTKPAEPGELLRLVTNYHRSHFPDD